MAFDLDIPSRVVARLGGPLKFRLIFQPLVAVILGVRHGWQDAKRGEPSLLASIITEPHGRSTRILALVKGILFAMILACVFDGIDQYLIFGWVRISGALTLGITIVALPYIAARVVTGWSMFKRLSRNKATASLTGTAHGRPKA